MLKSLIFAQALNDCVRWPVMTMGLQFASRKEPRALASGAVAFLFAGARKLDPIRLA